MHYYGRLSLLLLTLLLSLPTYADTELENAALARVIAVLNSLTPIINNAEAQQDKTTRVQFHYEALRADIEKIKQGINQKLQPGSIEPRVVAPIEGDYLLQQGSVAK